MKKLLPFILIVFLAGCTTTNVVPNDVDNNRYSYTRAGNGMLRFDHYTGKTWILVSGTNYWQEILEKPPKLPIIKLEDLLKSEKRPF
jgi:hypothetical protein